MRLTKKQYQLVANTIRGLSMDAVQKANSGHPGLPMGAADFVSVLYLRFLRYLPNKPCWPNRDRFILSAGHGCALLYSILHLAGYDLPLDELKQFRQWGSKTPGHPEHGLTAGVETSTGPLGQGTGNAVGMALAEAMLAARFNTKGHPVVDHTTYALISDGDLMEGISHEAFSLAGHLGLGKLVCFYDDNKITIEGETKLAYSDNVKKRFQGYHWKVLEVDGHDYAAIEKALDEARKETKKPTIIIGKTLIGKGSPNLAGTAKVHGEPLGEKNVKLAKENLGLDPNKHFQVPQEVRKIFAQRTRELKAEHAKCAARRKKFRKASPAKSEELDAFLTNAIPSDLARSLPKFDPDKAVATRSASGTVLQELAKHIPNLVGGSADLAPSNKTYLNGLGDIGPGSFGARNFRFGIREHAMGAIINGLILHGGFRAFGATFYVFSDYFRPAIRLAAIMELPAIYVLTHDSFYVGEDGPTHQPVEHSASLRCMPNVTVIRPSDATETGAAWMAALKNTSGPTAILLTRQNLPTVNRKSFPAASLLEKGAYTLWQNKKGNPQLILVASGSEVSLALEAGQSLAAKTKKVIRVVSMPSWELFEKQSNAYKESVFPAKCGKRLAIEAGSGFGWDKYVGEKGIVLGMDRFGASGPYKVLAGKFGFTAPNVARAAAKLLSKA